MLFPEILIEFQDDLFKICGTLKEGEISKEFEQALVDWINRHPDRVLPEELKLLYKYYIPIGEKG